MALACFAAFKSYYPMSRWDSSICLSLIEMELHKPASEKINLDITFSQKRDLELDNSQLHPHPIFSCISPTYSGQEQGKAKPSLLYSGACTKKGLADLFLATWNPISRLSSFHIAWYFPALFGQKGEEGGVRIVLRLEEAGPW